MKITIDTIRKKVVIIEDCPVNELNDFLKKAIPHKELKDYQIESAPVLTGQPLIWPLQPYEPYYAVPSDFKPFEIICQPSSFSHSSIHAFTH